MTLRSAFLVSLALLLSCSAPAKTEKKQESKRPPLERVPALKAQMKKLAPIHELMGPVQPGDWLETREEPGQTFDEYLKFKPVLARGKRKTLYVQPIGPFSEEQRVIVALGADFMSRYFGVPVKVLPDLPLSIIPEDAQRTHPSWGMHQLLTGYILDDVLHPRLPKDAAAYIGFTAVDLWPGRGWNFVFGYASFRKRVGVWSLARFGDPSESPEAFRLCLLRTIKIASHETGHMFSIRHCTAYECNMCGCMHQGESDRRPLTLCPECLPKILWGAELDAEERFESLIAFTREHGLDAQRERYERSLKALRE